MKNWLYKASWIRVINAWNIWAKPWFGDRQNITIKVRQRVWTSWEGLTCIRAKILVPSSNHGPQPHTSHITNRELYLAHLSVLVKTMRTWFSLIRLRSYSIKFAFALSDVWGGDMQFYVPILASYWCYLQTHEIQLKERISEN